MPPFVLQGFVEDAVSGTSNIAWSVCIRNGQGRELACFNHAASMKIASVGKLLLLIEVARRPVERPTESDHGPGGTAVEGPKEGYRGRAECDRRDVPT
jgi:hypothetical protein